MEVFRASFTASYKASADYQWSFLAGLLKPVDYARWIKRRHITPLDFGFISSGYEPMPNKLLFDIVEELQAVLHVIDCNVCFHDVLRSNKKLMQSVNDLFPKIKVMENVKKRIFKQAHYLLDRFEIIKRGMLVMPEEFKLCFSVQESSFKEDLWRFDFLIYWARTKVAIEIPRELVNLDERFDLQKELGDVTNKDDLRHSFGKGEIMRDGLVDVRKIMSTKLVLAIENYVLNMNGVAVNKIPSSSAVERELIDKYGSDGVTEAIARSINEGSRHDAKAKVDLSSAREKTIFFQ